MKLFTIQTDCPEIKEFYSVPPMGLLLGRSEECAIVFSSSKVSRQHCYIFCLEGEWYIENMSAVNILEVNGQEIREPVILKQGDEFSLVDNIFKFESDEYVPDFKINIIQNSQNNLEQVNNEEQNNLEQVNNEEQEVEEQVNNEELTEQLQETLEKPSLSKLLKINYKQIIIEELNKLKKIYEEFRNLSSLLKRIIVYSLSLSLIVVAILFLMVILHGSNDEKHEEFYNVDLLSPKSSKIIVGSQEVSKPQINSLKLEKVIIPIPDDCEVLVDEGEKVKGVIYATSRAKILLKRQGFKPLEINEKTNWPPKFIAENNTLKITSDPKGAAVRIGSVFYGRTPCIVALSEGIHEVYVGGDIDTHVRGYKVEIKENQPINNLHVELPIALGKITIKTFKDCYITITPKKYTNDVLSFNLAKGEEYTFNNLLFDDYKLKAISKSGEVVEKDIIIDSKNSNNHTSIF